MHYPAANIQIEFRINRFIRNQNSTKKIHRRQTTADGQTDRHLVLQQTVVFILKKYKQMAQISELDSIVTSIHLGQYAFI